jgi:hypothetical protein
MKTLRAKIPALFLFWVSKTFLTSEGYSAISFRLYPKFKLTICVELIVPLA